jgi:anhydro-N-acetylmuramic acid kinase
MDWQALRDKTERYAIGLMSGTSCDGVDAALVRIKHTGPPLALKLIAFKSVSYTDTMRRRLLSTQLDAYELSTLNVELGELFAKASLRMMKVAKAENVEVDFIASSGHTVAHYPAPKYEVPSTFQITEAAIIAERCGVPVVSNFRPRDIAAGGQGAPLVPYADWVLFNRPDRTSAFLNIGGIANVTVVPPKLGDVLAFDTGPGNMVIDGAMDILTSGKKAMDVDGEWASNGKVIDEFLAYLLEHPYFVLHPPKSTGREEFGPDVYIRDALIGRRNEHSSEDLIATITKAVSESILQALKGYVLPSFELDRLIISGGGAHNKTLMRQLKAGLPGITVRRSDHYSIPADAREAIAFAILGNETLCGTPANVPSATGASHPVILGQITPG